MHATTPLSCPEVCTLSQETRNNTKDINVSENEILVEQGSVHVCVCMCARVHVCVCVCVCVCYKMAKHFTGSLAICSILSVGTSISLVDGHVEETLTQCTKGPREDVPW
jgi:hypothetical protein